MPGDTGDVFFSASMVRPFSHIVLDLFRFAKQGQDVVEFRGSGLGAKTLYEIAPEPGTYRVIS